MEIGAIFLVLAVTLLVGMYITQPFLQPRRRSAAEDHEMSALLAERDRVVSALQELDFDFNLNKIPAETYPAQRAELLQKGAQVLQQLDALQASSSGNGSGGGEDAADRIESAVAVRRADLASAPAAPRDEDDVEALISARRKTRKERSGGFCPRCGKPMLASDRFCPHCGKSIA